MLLRPLTSKLSSRLDIDVAVGVRLGFVEAALFMPKSPKRLKFVFSVAGKLAVDGTGDGVYDRRSA